MARVPNERTSAAIVVGIGTADRGDDEVGLHVARRLRPRLEGVCPVLELQQEGTSLLEAWESSDLAVVADAVVSGAPPGAVHRIEVGSGPLPASLGTTSTHGLSLAQAIALGQALHRLPRRLLVYGVEGTAFGLGEPMTPAVRNAVDGVVRRIEEDVRSAGASGSREPDGEVAHA